MATRISRVTSYTRAPKKGTPAYDLWLLQRNATFNALEEAFWFWCRVKHATDKRFELPERQKALYPGGKPFDFRFLGHRIFVEIDGLSWKPGEPMGHQTAAGYERDRRKDCEAAAYGWLVLRLTGSMLDDGSGYEFLERAMQLRRGLAA